MHHFDSDVLEDLAHLDDITMDTAWIVDAHESDDFWLPSHQPDAPSSDETTEYEIECFNWTEIPPLRGPSWQAYPSEKESLAAALNTPNLPVDLTACDFINETESKRLDHITDAGPPVLQGEYFQQIDVPSPPSLSVAFSSYSNSSPPKDVRTATCGRQRKLSKLKRGAKAMYPVPPLTAYNFFFRVERDRLLKEEAACNGNENEQPVPLEDHPWFWILRQSNEFQDSVLQDQWGRDPNAKRKHSKAHGRISFTSMTAQIAKSWNVLPGELKDTFREIAAADFERYSTARRKLIPNIAH